MYKPKSSRMDICYIACMTFSHVAQFRNLGEESSRNLIIFHNQCGRDSIICNSIANIVTRLKG
jgi:hypothetical protein